MRSPAGIGDAGRKLWKSIDAVFDFEEEPGKVHILTQACRVAYRRGAGRRRRRGTVDRQGVNGTARHQPDSSLRHVFSVRCWRNCWAGWACPTTTKTTRPENFGLVGRRLVVLRLRPVGIGVTDVTRRRNSKVTVEVAPTPTAADHFKSLLGWRPNTRPFHTSANRECGGCRAIKPGSRFDVPVTPGRPDLNTCRECAR